MTRLEKQDRIIESYLLGSFNPDMPDLDTFTDTAIDELYIDLLHHLERC